MRLFDRAVAGLGDGRAANLQADKDTVERLESQAIKPRDVSPAKNISDRIQSYVAKWRGQRGGR
jgi:hypothetical protein